MNRHYKVKRPIAAVLAAAAIVGVLIRFLVLQSPGGRLGTDEAYTGIESFEILAGHLPLTLGGTVYTLPFEAYLYAPIVALVGANVVTLKLISTVSWVATSVVLYFAAASLRGRRTAVIATAFFWVTPGALLIISVTAYSGYASGMLVTVGAFWSAVCIVDAATPRRWLMAVFGVLAGFGFWLHPMFLASLIPMVVLVLGVHRRRIDAWVTVVGGATVGCLPLLLWNAVNGFPSLDTPVDTPGTYWDRIRTFGVDLVPRAFGLRNANLEWIMPSAIAVVVYFALIAVVIYGAVVVVRQSKMTSRLLLPAVLIGVFPLMAYFPNLIFAIDGRYAIISFPFLIIAMASGVDALARRVSVRHSSAVLLTCALIWFGFLVLPTVKPLLTGRTRDPNADFAAVAELLGESGVERVYGSYWVSLPVEFVGDRDLVGAVFPFFPIRFPERQRTVGATDPEGIAVVFEAGGEDTTQLLLPIDRYDRSEIGSVVVYVPKATSDAG